MSKGGKKRRSRKPAAPPPEAAVEVVPEVTVQDFAGKEWDFAFLPDAEPEVVNEPALHALIKQWRHGRATRTIGQALSDAYFAIFTVVLLGAMVTNAIVGSQEAMGPCTTDACMAGRGLVSWGVLFAVCGLSASVARLFGPVLASAAEGFWLLDAPLRRSPLLRPRLRGIIIAAGIVGFLVGGVIALLGGDPWLMALAWASATGASASAVMAWGAVEQSYDRTRPLRVGQALSSLSAIAVLGVMVVGSTSGWLVLPPSAWFVLAPWILAGMSLLVAVVCAVTASRRLESFARARLTSGGTLVSGMQGAMFGLDFGLARDILVEREAAVRGHVRPTRGRGVGITALIWRDAQRLLRFPKPLFGVVGAALVPYVANALGLGVITPLIGGIALFVALIPTFGSLRVLSRTSGLARSLPLSTRQIRLAAAAVPAVLAVLWSVLATFAFEGLLGGVQRDLTQAALTSLTVGTAGIAGAMRWQTAKPVNFQVPMMATETGAVPPTLIFNVIRGFDMIALITAPILLGLDPIWGLGIAVVVLSFLSSGMNTADMTEEAKEQQQMLEAERARGQSGTPAKQKTTVAAASRRGAPQARRRNTP